MHDVLCLLDPAVLLAGWLDRAYREWPQYKRVGLIPNVGQSIQMTRLQSEVVPRTESETRRDHEYSYIAV